MEHWVIYGLCTGLFWGGVAVFLYVPFKEMTWERKPWWCRGRSIAIMVNQFTLNFVAAFAGWYCLHLFYAKSEPARTMDWIEFFLLLMFLLSITGRLSAILWNIPEAIVQYIHSKMKTEQEPL